MTLTANDIADRFRRALNDGNDAWADLMEELYADEIRVAFVQVPEDSWRETPWDPSLGPAQGSEPLPLPDRIPSASIIAFSRSENAKMSAFYPDYRFEDVDVTVSGNDVVTWWAHAGTFPDGSTFSDLQNFIYSTENGRIVSVTRRSTPSADELHLRAVRASGFGQPEDFKILDGAFDNVGQRLVPKQ